MEKNSGSTAIRGCCETDNSAKPKAGAKSSGLSAPTSKFPLVTDVHPQSLTPSTKYFDSHAHLDLTFQSITLDKEKAKKKKKSLVADEETEPMNFGLFRRTCWKEGLEGILHVCCFLEQYPLAEELINEDGVWGAYGVHPHAAKSYTDELEEEIVKRIQTNKKVLAWGEMGLDYFYNNSPAEKQREVLERQLTKAMQLDKPLVIHTRDAEDDTFKILKKHLKRDTHVHIHCWSSGPSFAEKLMLEFDNVFFGFTGAITFKNGGEETRSTVDFLPLDRILLETDSPYMAPGVHRGSASHSGMIPVVAEQIAAIKNISFAQVCEATLANTKRMYKLI